MTESKISFENDLKELTSPTNSVIGLIIPVILGIILNKEKIILNTLAIFGVLLLLIIIYFFIRWILFYRKITI